MKEMAFPAETQSLYQVLNFVGQFAKEHGFSEELQQIELAAEEIFTNICSYAYGEIGGTVKLTCETESERGGNGGTAQNRKGKEPRIYSDRLRICFMDTGIPYDPLKHDNPDITLPANQREIGGLGIFLTKEFMDTVFYEYKDGKNILLIEKSHRVLSECQ